MNHSIIDWPTHMARYEQADMTMEEYCKANEISLKTFRSRRYKHRQTKQTSTRSQFREFNVGCEFKVSIGDDGSISMSELEPHHIVDILRALGAVSH